MKTFLLLLSFALQAAPLSQTVDLDGARVKFLAVGRPSLLKIHGQAKGDKPLSGVLQVIDGVLTADASLALESLDTGITLRNQHMKDKYLETARYPQARLVIDPSRVADGEFPFEGKLTLHGQTQPIQGVGRIETGQAMTLRFKVSIAKFGIETPSFMGIRVTDEVEVETEVPL